MQNDDIPTIGEWAHRLPKWQRFIFHVLCLTKLTEQAILFWYGFSNDRRKKH